LRNVVISDKNFEKKKNFVEWFTESQKIVIVQDFSL
jgi:hypothetical protein